MYGLPNVLLVHYYLRDQFITVAICTVYYKNLLLLKAVLIAMDS